MFTFQLATLQDKDLIQQWWTKPHVIEFWDNSPETWQNVENYLQGKKVLFDYWIGFIDQKPFSLLMTSDAGEGVTPNHPSFPWLEAKGTTLTIDFMIGEEAYLGKGLSYLTLKAFGEFLKQKGVSALFIDPETNNEKAIHVYQRAGFKIVSAFVRETGYFAGIKHYLMKMKL